MGRTITLQPKTSHHKCDRHLWKRLHWAWWKAPTLRKRQPRKVPVRPRSFAQPLLAAIDEGDKIRTIYDGSWDHANSHIQQNTVEKTTAPTVMDCIQAIHWLNTAKAGSTPAVAQGTDTGWTPSEDHRLGYPQSRSPKPTDESRSPRRGGDFK